MRPERPKKIDTQAAQQPRPGLNGAFAGLALSGLPEDARPSADLAPGTATGARSESQSPGPGWKPGRVVLRRETAQRGGKVVVVVDDFATHLPLSFIERLAKQLRSACGCGGTCRGRAIELQGDHPAKIRALLEAEGFTVAGVR